MIAIYVISGMALLLSILNDRQKTLKALKMAWIKLANVLPHFLLMVILISISLFFIPDSVIAKYLGAQNLYLSSLWASIIGSVAVMPGFVAFPLGGVLVSKGVPYMVIAAFTTTLMLVGVLSFPFEKKILGTKVAVTRNIICYLVAVIIALIVGLAYGEIG